MDPLRLRQVVGNLVGNALEYAPRDGEVAVRLRGRRLEVRDNGPPVPPDLRDRLFDPFTRGHADADGRGLGPWICRVIVEAHGGTIGATTDDSGNCFWFELPQRMRPLA